MDIVNEMGHLALIINAGLSQKHGGRSETGSQYRIRVAVSLIDTRVEGRRHER